MNDSQFWISRLKWAFACLLFFGLPLIILSWGLGSTWNARERDSLEKRFLALDNVLLIIREEEDTRTYFRNFLRILANETGIPLSFTSSQRIPILAKRINRLKERFPGIFTFTVTDAEGNLIPELTTSSTSPESIKRINAALRVRRTNPRPLAKCWNDVKSFVGPEASADQFKAKEHELIDVSIQPYNQWFFFSLKRSFSFFVHAHSTPDWPFWALIDRSNRFNKTKYSRKIQTGVFKLSTFDGPIPEIPRVVAEAKRTSKSHFPEGEKLFSVMELDPGNWLWASATKEGIVRLDRPRMILCMVSTLIFSFLSIGSYLILFRDYSLRISIRWQLIPLFAFAGGLPVVVLVMASLDYLDQKYKAMVTASNDEVETSLHSFDRGYPVFRGIIEAACRKALSNAGLDTPKEKNRTIKICKKILKSFSPRRVVIHDEKGKPLWASDYDDTGESQSDKIINKLVGRVVKAANSQSDDAIDTDAAILESLAGEDPAKQFVRNIGKIFRMSLQGEQRLWLYITPIRNTAGKVSHIVKVHWLKFELDRKFIPIQLRRAERLSSNLKLYFSNPGDNWRYPVKTVFPISLRLLLKNIALSQTTISRIIQIKGKRYLATGLKLREFHDSYIVGIKPEKILTAKIASFRRMMWLLDALMVFISIFLGIMLAQKFLLPINRLSKGVEAIQQRNFNFRIPIDEPDEFGRLSMTFNRVIEGLTDLEVARIVQESLLPSGEAELGQYRVFGVSRSASELGGDYFDVQILMGKKIFFLIGDVSGHGVASALVMAMAKALLERESSRGTERISHPGENGTLPGGQHPHPDGIETSSESILQSLHRILYKTMKRKRMMTCFGGTLDPETHTFSMTNAGHNYPFLFRKGKPPQNIKLTGSPLGSMKNAKMSSDTLLLEPGDRLFFYTDGLVEAKAQGEVIGYERMAEAVSHIITENPRESCEKILEWHTALTGGGFQEDDITIAVMARQSSG